MHKKKDLLLTKDDKIEFASKIEEDKGDLITRIEGVKTELITRIEGVKAELITRIETGNTRVETVKAEMIKWMFIFWIGTVGVLSGIMITLFNIYSKH